MPTQTVETGTTGIILQGIRALISELSRSARTIERGSGVSNAQLFILQQLASAGEALTVGQLASLAHTTPGAVSIITTRLGRKGLLSRRSGKDDARRVELSLTTRGRALIRRAPTPPTVRLLAAVDQLSPSKRRALADGLVALATELELDLESPALLFEKEQASRAWKARRQSRK
jgi:DNA-binding MarR family transcriptional regulator